MSRLFLPGCVLALVAAACAPVGNAPSLEVRSAEAIDPRLPVVDRSATLAADPELAAALGSLRQRAIAAAAQAEPAIRAAASAAAVAGPRESESWIVAQQRLSAAIATRAPFTAALSDLDRLIALRVRSRERLVPRDLAAAEALAAELGAIDRRQTGDIAMAGRRLQR
jgi:hypothetical protein